MTRVRIEISHRELHKYQVVTGTTQEEAEARARAKLAAWDDQYARQLLMAQKRSRLEDGKEEAATATRDAAETMSQLQNLLTDIVTKHKPATFQRLKRTATQQISRPEEPLLLRRPFKPHPKSSDLNWLAQILPPLRKSAERQAEMNHQEELQRWEQECLSIDKVNKEILRAYEVKLASWQAANKKSEADAAIHNSMIDQIGEAYRRHDTAAVEKLAETVVEDVSWPDLFPNEWDVAFDQDASLIMVNFQLPTLDDMPSTKQVKFITSTGEFETLRHRPAVIQDLFDSVVYQVALAIPFVIFKADYAEAARIVVFNGWVTYLDTSRGVDTTACIASLQVEREELAKLDLSRVDPKACFRALKGISSPQIHAMSPVAPIVSLDRSDSRFVQSREISENLQTGANVAAMGWEEFEHLIREVFEKEFSAAGGEVKVTQSSRDGGVDAVAFDPDPIRGGKIVIQAKRYTNTVDVSAVRDLYGTVMAEGATKGIIVTTSSFGPDAYKFAKGKPITLLDGQNLLFLLGKHGHQVRIDLAEAKTLGNSLRR